MTFCFRAQGKAARARSNRPTLIVTSFCNLHPSTLPLKIWGDTFAAPPRSAHCLLEVLQASRAPRAWCPAPPAPERSGRRPRALARSAASAARCAAHARGWRGGTMKVIALVRCDTAPARACCPGRPRPPANSGLSRRGPGAAPTGWPTRPRAHASARARPPSRWDSGGKDSCYSMLRCKHHGHEVRARGRAARRALRLGRARRAPARSPHANRRPVGRRAPPPPRGPPAPPPDPAHPLPTGRRAGQPAAGRRVCRGPRLVHVPDRRPRPGRGLRRVHGAAAVPPPHRRRREEPGERARELGGAARARGAGAQGGEAGRGGALGRGRAAAGPARARRQGAERGPAWRAAAASGGAARALWRPRAGPDVQRDARRRGGGPLRAAGIRQGALASRRPGGAAPRTPR
jgi:hypothetical protein